jgi:iron-sulfur cluster assembly protein
VALLKLRRSAHQEQDIVIPALENNTIGISDQAAERINFLNKEDNNLHRYLRVAIKGGGCSGLTIHYEFCEQPRPSDAIFTKDNAQLCIDPKSLNLLGGATLHFKDAHGVREFVLVNNPSEKQCSCGKSFSL